MEDISKNNMFIGVVVLLGAVGSKSVIQEFSEKCNVYFDWALPKIMALFALIFINTKDIDISISLAVVGYLFINYVIPDKPDLDKEEKCG